jgi:uncharacterized protein
MDVIEIPQGALDQLAVFPLPDLALFPHTLLPLHVFEPRYRALMADVLAGSRLLAVARLRPGYERDYEGRPPIHDVAGLGSCVSADRLPDGRYNVMLRGLARVRIERELPASRAYREVSCLILPDDRSTRAGELAAAHRKLVGLCDHLASAVPDGAPLRELARAIPSPGGCADVVASALLRDPDERQLLLELLDPADRLDRMIEAVSALVSRVGPPGPRGGTLLN